MEENVGKNCKMTKVLWITNIPSPYRVDFYEGLGTKLNLTVIFEKDKSNERDNSWCQGNFKNFYGIILNGVTLRTDSAFDLKIRKYLKTAQEYHYVVISNPLTLMGMYCIEYFKFHRIPFFIETDGGLPKNGYGFREKVKKHFIGSASGWLSTASIHEQYYIQYGADQEKIFRYPFTSIKEKDVLDSPIGFEAKRVLRDELDIFQNKIVLAVGQFIPRKGFDILLEISKDLSSDTAVVILGGTPTEDYKQIVDKYNLKNVYFPGFITREQIQKYYRAADVFVMPTREDIWGLVINEALAAGLPIITTDLCIAGTELVQDDVNGYVIPVDDKDGFLNAILKVIENRIICDEMGKASLLIAKEYTVEKMVEWHEKFFKTR